MRIFSSSLRYHSENRSAGGWDALIKNLLIKYKCALYLLPILIDGILNQFTTYAYYYVHYS